MRPSDPGLCRVCRHGRIVTSARGSVFRLCELSRIDPAFPRYPPLPVVRCAGFSPVASEAGESPEPEPET